MEQKMFCYQCQETAGCKGCTACGVCGKQPEVAVMQDLLVYVTKGLSAVTTQLRAEGQAVDKAVNHLISVNLFITITNANFDLYSITAKVTETLAVKEELLGQVQNKESLPEAALWNGTDYAEKAKTVGVLATENEDIRSLRELITYGLKGLAAYTKHANALLNDDEELDAFLQSALAKTLDDSLSVDDLVALTLEVGKYGVQGMADLDAANTTAYGNPEITTVDIGVRKNPAILHFLFFLVNIVSIAIPRMVHHITPPVIRLKSFENGLVGSPKLKNSAACKDSSDKSASTLLIFRRARIYALSCLPAFKTFIMDAISL